MAAPKDAQANPFIRQLASSNKRIRDRALSSLRTYLQRKTAFTDLELRKLWKGLFYCMWMSDKPRNQQHLAQDLADLLNTVSPTKFLGFAKAFWETIAAEWNNIDRLRLDKFLYLIRCYVTGGFSWLQKRGWRAGEELEQYLAVLKSVPLDARDAKIPNGLRYHVIDIYVDELDKVDTGNDAPLQQLLAPFSQLEKHAINKTVREKAGEALKDKRLRNWHVRHTLKEEEGEEEEEQMNRYDETHFAGKRRNGDDDHASRLHGENKDDYDTNSFGGFGD